MDLIGDDNIHPDFHIERQNGYGQRGEEIRQRLKDKLKKGSPVHVEGRHSP